MGCVLKLFLLQASLVRAATAGKEGKVWSLPRFWVSIRSYKKQPVKNFLGRILDLAWLKFAVGALLVAYHCVDSFWQPSHIERPCQHYSMNTLSLSIIWFYKSNTSYVPPKAHFGSAPTTVSAAPFQSVYVLGIYNFGVPHFVSVNEIEGLS
jgi:hypothetical protein